MTRALFEDLMTSTTETFSVGRLTSQGLRDDPRFLVFMLSRYKFVAKMFEGCKSVLEVGCGDGFGGLIVAQAVDRLTGIEVEPLVLEDRSSVVDQCENFEMLIHDVIDTPMAERFDAAYCLDVIEHIPPEDEDRFVHNIAASTVDHGALIVGTPNLAAKQYQSPWLEDLHINLKSHASLKETLLRHYHRVFMFGMNDEVLHTGFGPMCHYLMALAVEPRQ
ncbi:MAG TPA: class I SAM-dependent methyltransferase [Chloroflexota bacterium]